MNKKLENLIYTKWRESEAWQVPFTKEGEELAKARFAGFRQGFLAAMKYNKNDS